MPVPIIKRILQPILSCGSFAIERDGFEFTIVPVAIRPLANHVELLDSPKIKLSDWKIEKGKITLKGWFSATLKLQQGDAEAVENGTGSITTEDKGFDFSIIRGDDFKIAIDEETQKEFIETTLQAASAQ